MFFSALLRFYSASPLLCFAVESREVEKQNKTYFELKARELLERQKTDLVS